MSGRASSAARPGSIIWRNRGTGAGGGCACVCVKVRLPPGGAGVMGGKRALPSLCCSTFTLLEERGLRPVRAEAAAVAVSAGESPSPVEFPFPPRPDLT